MNSLQKTLKKENFFYQAGSVITTKAWYMPSYDKVESLLNDISNQQYPYDLYLVGGVANGKLGNTFDIDIIVKGALIYDEFEGFLDNIYNLALNKHRLLVDVRWIDKEMSYLEEIIDNDIVDTFKQVRFGYYLKKMGDEIIETNLFEKDIRLTNYLVERHIQYPTIKSLESSRNYIKI